MTAQTFVDDVLRVVVISFCVLAWPALIIYGNRVKREKEAMGIPVFSPWDGIGRAVKYVLILAATPFWLLWRTFIKWGRWAARDD